MNDLERFEFLVNRLEALTQNIATLVGLVVGYRSSLEQIRPALRVVKPRKDSSD